MLLKHLYYVMYLADNHQFYDEMWSVAALTKCESGAGDVKTLQWQISNFHECKDVNGVPLKGQELIDRKKEIESKTAHSLLKIVRVGLA